MNFTVGELSAHITAPFQKVVPKTEGVRYGIEIFENGFRGNDLTVRVFACFTVDKDKPLDSTEILAKVRQIFSAGQIELELDNLK